MIYRKHPYACLIAAGLMACGVMTTMEPFLDLSGLLIYALVFLGYHVGTLIAGVDTAPAGGKVTVGGFPWPVHKIPYAMSCRR